MPATLTYPGVYIEEIPSGVHTITGVATSITAFVGYAKCGLDNRAKQIFSFADFERAFGGLAADSELSYTVQQFFTNGGTTAYVVRVPKNGAKAATVTVQDNVSGGTDVLTITALSTGLNGNNLYVDVDYDAVPSADPKAFNLAITDAGTGTAETFRIVTMDKTKSNFVETVVNDEHNGSKVVSVQAIGATPNRPAETGTSSGDIDLSKIDMSKVNDPNKPITYVIDANVTVPPTAPVTVKVSFVTKGDSMPSSVLGACRLLERKLNAALAANSGLSDIIATCLPNSGGKGIRVRLLRTLKPNELTATKLDSSVTFAKLGGALGVSEGEADDALHLDGKPADVAHYWLGTAHNTLAVNAHTQGDDGSGLPTSTQLTGDPSKFTGIYALDKVDLFNILCIPDATRADPSDPSVVDSNVDPNAIFSAAVTYCRTRRAFLLVDAPPNVKDVDTATDWKSSTLTVHDENAAAYFPRLRLPDPLNEMKLRTFAPCGVIAGVYARTDASRGVWKAPAGTEATLAGVQQMVYKLTDPENGVLNPLGLNCLRIFPIYGAISWGARTLVGADADASEWKYVPVRRMALFLEESLYRGTKWVVFEPNDEPLWSQIRLNVGAFMQDLFRQGAFQGKTPKEAYFVKCDSETTTQSDIDKGIVNIIVGFAPLKPAEFVVIKIQQIAGQLAT